MSARFIPALNRAWLTPLYDPALAWLMRDAELKGALVRTMTVGAGERILDLGCGTGTLTVLRKRMFPHADIHALDIDPAILERAGRHRTTAAVQFTLSRGSATDLPYASGRFDHVVSSLMIHHLKGEQKAAAMREVFRVLKPGGQLHVLDFGPPRTRAERGVVAFMKRFEETADNFAGRLPQMFAAAGLEAVREVDHRVTIFGPVSFYRAQKPRPG